MSQTYGFAPLSSDDFEARPHKPSAKFIRAVHALSHRKRRTMLERDAERDLIGKVQRDNDRAALETLIDQFTPFITGIATAAAARSNMQDHLEDLISQGIEGFVKAVRNFDLETNPSRLSTFARYHVSGDCLTYCLHMKYPFRFGTNLDDRLAFYQLNKIEALFEETHGRPMRATPHDAELAAQMVNVSAKGILRALTLREAKHALTIETVQIYDDPERDETARKMTLRSINRLVVTQISPYIASLSERDSDIVSRMFAGQEDLVEMKAKLAERHSLTVERIGQIYRGALSDIRARLKTLGIEGIDAVA